MVVTTLEVMVTTTLETEVVATPKLQIIEEETPEGFVVTPQ
jgi:hypothetical protein